MLKKEKNINLTEGSIFQNIILFTIPLIGGLVFQQLYSVVDTIVVGRFIGETALAAIGTTAPTINMLIGFMIGMTTGIGVLVSQFFGAKDELQLKQCVCTSVLMCLLGGLLVTTIGIIFTPFLLQVLKTPANVFPHASLYLRCYFSGGVFISLYNMGATILRSIGDSKRPLIILIISSIINIILDLVFVLIFSWGIFGVGLATVLSQVFSCFYTLYILSKEGECYCLPTIHGLKKESLSIEIAKKVFIYGFPAGIQQTIVSFSNMLVQSHINVFGSTVIAGWSAYWRLSDCGMLPINALVLTATTYTGQHFGAGNIKRLRAGMNQIMLLGSVYTVFLCILFYFGIRWLLFPFCDGADVIEKGMIVSRTVLFAYIPLTLFQLLTAAIRGFGKNGMAMLISAGNGCGLRLILLYLFDYLGYSSNMRFVFSSYPLTWVNTFICAIIYYYYFLHHYSNKFKV